jgi:hypothetical protein
MPGTLMAPSDDRYPGNVDVSNWAVRCFQTQPSELHGDYRLEVLHVDFEQVVMLTLFG